MKTIIQDRSKLTALFVSLTAIAIAFAMPSFVKVDDPATLTVKAQFITNLQAPTSLIFPGNGKAWVTEQTGKVRLIKDGKLTDVVVLDLKPKMLKVNSGYEERGLLNILLHPKFSSNGKFYVYYSRAFVNEPGATVRYNHTDVLAEYKMLPNSDQADPNSEHIILTQDKPDGNHNGGGIVFGADGYLYVSFGDGGGQHDRHGTIGNGQDLNTWLGKILRININADGGGYTVPKDNPFVGKASAKPEIWCYGFRNPYRITLDKVSKQIFVGEVGQDLWEEVDIAEKGANYGWRLVEGNHCHNPATGCDFTGITAPITEYDHKEGISVIGGYVYNGQQIPSLKSKYVFGDWTGPVWYLQKAGDKWLRGKIEVKDFPANAKITGWGEDQSGELYVLTNTDTGPGPAGSTTGGVYKIVK